MFYCFGNPINAKDKAGTTGLRKGSEGALPEGVQYVTD